MNKHVMWAGAATLAVCFIAGIFVSQKGFDIQPENQSTTSDDADPAAIFEPQQDLAPDLAKALEEDPADLLPPEPQAGIPGVPPDVPISINMAYVEDGRYVVRTETGHRIILTIDPDLQNDMSSMMRNYDIPHAAFAAVEPQTGRVLALVGEEAAKEPIGDVALKAMAPSASIFKLITAAALIEGEGFDPATRTCYPLAGSVPSDGNVLGSEQADEACADLGTAFGQSNNYVFSRLAHKHLDSDELLQWASRFGYNEPIPFNLPMDPSRADFTDLDPATQARAAAGFWHTHLNPLHSALIAATVANGGVMMRPNLIEEILDPDGNTIYAFMPVPYKQVIKEDTARKLAEIMVYSTTVGTAAKHMRNPKNLPPEYIVAGKTGTLSQKKPYLMFSWFVGFAPIERPDIALGVLLCNPARWRIKASYAAARGLKLWREKKARMAKAQAPPATDPAPDEELPEALKLDAPAETEPAVEP